MQKCGFRLGGVQFLAKFVCRCWGFKNRAPEGGFGRLFGVENGVQTGKMRSERPIEKRAVLKTVKKSRRKRRVILGAGGVRPQKSMSNEQFIV